MILNRVGDRVLQTVRVGLRHSRLGFGDEELVLGVVRLVTSELEADDVTPLGGVVPGPSVLVTQSARAPVAEQVLDVVGNKDLTEVTGPQAWAGRFRRIWEQDRPQILGVAD